MGSRTSNQASLYLRSSKDRSDVSIDAQRRELTALAAQRGLVIVEEFADVVGALVGLRFTDRHEPLSERSMDRCIF